MMEIVMNCLQRLKFDMCQGWSTPDARVFRVMRISLLLCRCLKGKIGGCLRPLNHYTSALGWSLASTHAKPGKGSVHWKRMPVH